MTVRDVRQALWKGLPFGGLFGIMLGCSMAFTIIVGAMMGYCDRKAVCGDGIGSDLALAFPVAVVATIAVWLLCSALKATFSGRLAPLTLNLLLTALTIILVWIGLNPLLEVVLAMKE
jgi:hypothetical protein